MIHCGITPFKFVIGLPGTKSADVIHVVDFRRAKQYRDPKTKQHIPYRERRSILGTPPVYTSINAGVGMELSRRDDLVAIGYVIMYFLRGSLPWQESGEVDVKTARKITKRKQTTSIEDLCK